MAALLSMLPVPVAAAFGVALALSIKAITAALAWNADFVSPMVMADSLGTSHGPKEVIFGTYAPLTTLWFDVATRHLPFHRAIWRLGPLLLTVVGLAALGWAVWRTAGPWAALLTGCISFVGSYPVLATFLAQANHGPTYFLVCVLVAFLVFLVTRPPTPLVLALAAVLGVVAGLNIASDPLLLLVGMGPFLAAALLVSARHRSADLRHLAPLAGGVTGLALVVALVTSRAMSAAGYAVLGVSQGNPLDPASPADVRANFDRLVNNVLHLFNAYYKGPFGFTTPLRVLLAGAAVAGLCVPVALLVRSLATRTSPPTPKTGDSRPARDLLQVFWGLVVLGLLAGLVLSRLAVENAPRAIGYMTPLFLAVAATVPIAARRSPPLRALVGCGAALFCAFSLASVVRAEIPRSYDGFTFVKDGDRVLRVLEDEGIHRGYASYGPAGPLTFRFAGRIRVYPVLPCLTPSGATLCGFAANRVRSWYNPKPGPSFVIADPTQPWAVVAPPPAALGAPVQVFQVGSQTVYVYAYDVASRFGPTG